MSGRYQNCARKSSTSECFRLLAMHAPKVRQEIDHERFAFGVGLPHERVYEDLRLLVARPPSLHKACGGRRSPAPGRPAAIAPQSVRRGRRSSTPAPLRIGRALACDGDPPAQWTAKSLRQPTQDVPRPRIFQPSVHRRWGRREGQAPRFDAVRRSPRRERPGTRESRARRTGAERTAVLAPSAGEAKMATASRTAPRR